MGKKKKVNIKQNIDNNKERMQQHWDAIKDIVKDMDEEFNEYLKKEGNSLFCQKMLSILHNQLKKSIPMLIGCSEIEKGNFATLNNTAFKKFVFKNITEMNDEIYVCITAMFLKCGEIIDKYMKSIQYVEKDKGFRPTFEKE